MSLPPDDRCSFAPKHTGLNVFPNFYFFSRLVRLAHKPRLLAINDVTFGYKATYQQFLTDVLHFRNILRQTLDPTIVAKLDRDEEVFINLLGPSGYEFAVAFLSLMALGAVIVPISPDIPVKEATYFATKCKSSGVVTAAKCTKLAGELQAAMTASSGIGFHCVQVTEHLMRPPLRPEELIISSDAYLDINKSGLVIFTSGTTGPPKGAVKRRGFLYDVATIFADAYDMREGDLVLHVLPVHHATGVTLTLLPFLFSGACIEFRSGGFDAAWTWERIKRADLDFFSGVPTIYMRLMQTYENKLAKLPEAQREPYVKGASRIRAMLCGTSALPRPLSQKWKKLRDGKEIITRYGGTEFGGTYTVTPWMENVPDGSVGPKSAGVDMRLGHLEGEAGSQSPAGDLQEGEILVRSPIMFSKYLFDQEATKKALNSDGYFKTGDIARREGDMYWIMGRASVDIIKSGGYKISALDIEREILGLDYVSEVMVVGVEDEEFGQRVAAAIVLKEDAPQDLSIDRLRQDLRTSLAGYKMPTMLRVVKELRKNATGKVVKKALLGEYFPKEGDSNVQMWKGRKSKL
ncbi:hypothetical protein PMZ80_004771 [Knufia obscura]|uniref:Acetyl-CoA synthetase-like protein n=2 Tax=Knufia TaxID=430999 RepID=A0AAN8F7D8_9EURO|nr:hypothetical protein PMZ80_004771 [Knufia obscura]KAK5952766.1 hypothetical protein OHC33_006359 [Knufia fluminis]